MKSRSWRSLARPVSRKPAKRSTCKPQLEILEDLTLPSGITISPTHVQSGNPIHGPQAGSSTPSGLTPAQVRHAYGFDQVTFQNGTIKGDGTGQTIAIIDAFDDPSIVTDLSVFDQQFGLPAPPSFTKVGLNSRGVASTTTFPTPDASWAGETELDVEWAHAVAPGASILLVEANSDSDTDLLRAVDYARKQPGVVAVSMSWGSSETSSEASSDSYFTTPSGHGGVSFFGSSGDDGSPGIWPALSTHVIGVGGTVLNIDSQGNYLSETGWSGSGGSRSLYLAQPSYQAGLVISNGTTTVSASGKRVGPDVAYVASPSTGVAVYGTYGWGGWSTVGGTSASAPQWAALLAIADQGRALAGLSSLDGFTQTLPALYKLPSSDFHDVTSGSNGGFRAGTGYDLVTGRGTPIANLVVRDLVGGSSGSTPPVSNSPPTIATPAKIASQTATAANLSVLGADNSGETSLTYNWSLAGGPASVNFSQNGSNAAKNTTATFQQAGTYTLKVTLTDPAGLTVSGQVTVSVTQALTTVTVSPGSVTLAPGGTQQFTASGLDQFGNALAQTPSFTWSLGSGSRGTISNSGLYTAASTTGSAVVQVAAGGKSSTATVSVANSSVGLTDNFESGTSQWSVTSGRRDYFLDNNSGNHRLGVSNDGFTVSRIVAGQTTWTNYSYQATLNIDFFSSGSASLAAREQDNNHLYFFGYNVALGEWMIAIKNGSTVTILGTSAPYTFSAGQDYTVRADLNGSSLKLYANGVLQVAVTDSTFASGQIGFTATNATAYLDNVTVTLNNTAQTSARQTKTGSTTSGSSPVSNAGVPSSSLQAFYNDIIAYLIAANPNRWINALLGLFQ